ncbi:MAG: ATP-binding cassette domain-containing protein [Mariprofundus sp.]|nr:ATP-binding cassette domain-containing protein [Mariprofundus sp.]
MNRPKVHQVQMNRIQITAGLGSLALQVDAHFNSELIIISGENGTGKTTLLRCLAGLQQAQGQVTINSQVWLDSCAGFSLPPEQRQVGCVWADAALLPWLSIEKNIVLGGDNVDVAWLHQLADQLEVTPLLQRQPQMLSTGEKQRIALARAMYRKPSVLLLDEPFSAQAPAIRGRLREVLRSIQAELQTPVIMVSHDAEDAKVLAHQHWHMREGKLLNVLPRHSPAEGHPEYSEATGGK